MKRLYNISNKISKSQSKSANQRLDRKCNGNKKNRQKKKTNNGRQNQS